MKKNRMKDDKGIVIDIGTGDGKMIYDLAGKHPKRFFIGIDPNHGSLIKNSAKIYKKKSKGGLSNVMYVVSDVENLPNELNGVGNQVFIILPWKSLLEGLVYTRKKTLQPISRIMKIGAFLDIVLGYNRLSEGKKVELPKLSRSYIETEMKSGFENNGFRLLTLHEIDKKEISQVNSSWSKKLTFGKDRNFYFLRFEKIKD